jgi:colicin import membrane protein
MSTLVYREPYKLPAGLLALAVHVLFFGLLYFGFSWHTQPPQGMVVDLWSDIPDAKTGTAKTVERPAPKPAAPPKPVETPKPVVEQSKPQAQPKPEIALKELKKQPEKPKPVERREPKPASRVDTRAEQQAAAEQAAAAAAEAAQAAAQGKVINEFIGRIRAKIRSNIVMPPDVADDALAIFDVTLLPDGSVMFTKLKKSSGNDAYDNAVERAIKKSDPLPLPPDVTLFQRNFRNLELMFKPKDIQ